MTGSEKREFKRKPLRLELNYRDAEGGNFLFEHSQNISDGGIFIETDHSLPIGATLVVRFSPPAGGPEISLSGTVAWVNAVASDDDTPNPGMGIAWDSLSEDEADIIKGIVKAIAIL